MRRVSVVEWGEGTGEGGGEEGGGGGDEGVGDVRGGSEVLSSCARFLSLWR